MKILLLFFCLISLSCIAQDSTAQTKKKVFYGVASFYSKSLQNSKTATGERYRHEKLTGASNNVKLGTWVRVINLKNKKTVIVRINDRMHNKMAKRGRVVDLSRSAAQALGFINGGLVKVKMEVIPAQ